MPDLTSFAEVALLLVMAAAIGLVGTLARQPLIVLAIMGAMGYRKRTGFLAGLTLAKISEFSLIFVAMGVSIGNVTEDALGLVTIAASTYMITFSYQLYALFEQLLGVDFNPQKVRRWRDLGLEADFGDASDPEFVAEPPFQGAEWLVSPVPIHPTGQIAAEGREAG